MVFLFYFIKIKYKVVLTYANFKLEELLKKNIKELYKSELHLTNYFINLFSGYSEHYIFVAGKLDWWNFHYCSQCK